MCKIIQKKTEDGFIINKKVVDAPINNIAYNGTEHSIKLADSYQVILDEKDIEFIVRHVPQKIENYVQKKKVRLRNEQR
jgi:hypothetical protein|tara:strand:+ start:3162 stop:3398 length:237 start_codon:yes stop_codon:yes gene_type:complete